MIFYIATDADQRRHVMKTQEEAKAIDKDFSKIDIPVDKDGLRNVLQDFFEQLEASQ